MWKLKNLVANWRSWYDRLSTPCQVVIGVLLMHAMSGKIPVMAAMWQSCQLFMLKIDKRLAECYLVESSLLTDVVHGILFIVSHSLLLYMYNVTFLMYVHVPHNCTISVVLCERKSLMSYVLTSLMFLSLLCSLTMSVCTCGWAGIYIPHAVHVIWLIWWLETRTTPASLSDYLPIGVWLPLN